MFNFNDVYKGRRDKNGYLTLEEYSPASVNELVLVAWRIDCDRVYKEKMTVFTAMLKA